MNPTELLILKRTVKLIRPLLEFDETHREAGICSRALKKMIEKEERAQAKTQKKGES